MKKNIYLALYVIFALIVFISGVMVWIGKLNNAGLSIISMVFALVFANLYNSEKRK